MRRWLKLSLGALGALLALALVAAVVSYALAEKKEVLATVSDNSELPSLRIDGVLLHLESFGNPENPTLIGLHGGPGNDYRHLLGLKALSDDYHVVLYDQRAAGLSERVASERISLQSLVDELDAIANHFSPREKVFIVGHSWGAMLASAYTERHSDRVHDLVLIEPGFLTQVTADHFLKHGMPAFSFAALRAIWGIGFESLKLDGPDDDAGMDHFVFRLATTELPGNPMLNYFCQKKAPAGAFQTWRMGVRSSLAIQSSSFNKDLQLQVNIVADNAMKFPGDVLILAGDCNTLIGPEHQKQHLPLFRSAHLRVLEGTGHMMLEEKTEEVLSVVRKHFDKTRGAL